ncbi:ATP-grasp fold amidoligase family protein [Erwinia sp. 198]|uniref:ATP-grasp fold amidoligase family protein n=1 Tax=Erwinia sp. 198 TaxID=2022746 RepID=UPI000F688159|nr:ATP-grasp fold amidoligase family protein [Erwinia sp. 198]RRZ86186.1 glycosyltransferase [Erwinia sp. 198]
MYLFKKIEHQGKIFRHLLQKEEKYLLTAYRKRHCGADIFRHPESLNEKIIHRMLYTRNDIYTQLADKYRVRDYVAKKIGENYLIPLLGVWRCTADIDYAALPDKFVLKCNHDSGSCQMVFAKDAAAVARCNKKLDFFLNRNFYYVSLEWQYKNIPPLILAEQYIDIFASADPDITPELYRVHCFHQKARFTEADFTDASGNKLTNIYDEGWRLQPFTMGQSNNPRAIPRPAGYARLLELAEMLSEGIDYCRVDFFMNKENIWFSEITFTPERGKIKFSPRVWDYRLGELWQLPSDINN